MNSMDSKKGRRRPLSCFSSLLLGSKIPEACVRRKQLSSLDCSIHMRNVWCRPSLSPVFSS